MTGAVTVRPAGPALMLLASLGGMALGFIVDSRSLGPEALASLCRDAPLPLNVSIAHHWDLLRGTLIGMAVSGLAASVIGNGLVPGARAARLGFDLICNLAMLAGMLLGGWLGPAFAASLGAEWGVAGMFVAMAIGMAGGFAGWVLLTEVVRRHGVEIFKLHPSRATAA